MTSKLLPKKHQIKGARFAVNARYSILAMDMGTGKSFTALRAWRKSGAKKLLVVCPASLLLNWKQEIYKWYGDRFAVSVFSKGEQIYDVWDTDIVIISYDLGKKTEYFMNWCDYIVIDEAHELKSLSAQRTQYYHRTIYEYSIPYLTLLTGTPIQNSVFEFYSLIAMCCYNPEYKGDFLERFPDVETFADYFSHRYEIVFYNGGRRMKEAKWRGFRNVKELKQYLKPIYFRVSFEDVYDLEPIVFKDILISESADKELEKEYQRLSKLYEGDDYSKINSERKRLSALEKVPFTIKYVKNLIDSGHKVAVYSDHIESCDALAEAFGVPSLTGKMNGKERWQHAKEFQDGRTNPLCATIGALSTGVDMTVAWNLVTNDESWVPGRMDQVYARIRRMGQTKTCVVHRIFGSPQDQAIAEKQQDKRRTIAAVT